MKRRGAGSPGGKHRYRDKAQPVKSLKPVTRFGTVELWIMATLALATLGIYCQVVSHQFINFDDDLYVRDNAMVNAGVTLKGITWAFTTFHSANWHPVTWLSHMIDCQLFGLSAGKHLLVSVFIHVANTLLLFVFLNKVTGSKWRSATVAALFALHPLHVESVAWISERKDTLSTFFGFLCLLAYARYVENFSARSYSLVVLWLALGLMAKPMIVSWPFLLLLLDYWPLRRVSWQAAETLKSFTASLWPLIREKLPLFCLAFGSMVVTYIAQVRGEAVAGLTAAPLSWRLANALVAYAKYLLLTVWPHDLAIYYPAPEQTAPVWQWGIALVLLVTVTTLALRNVRKRPYLATGWFWFLGTLIPVIGFVQVGSQAMADRYTYVPSVGLFVLIIFGLADLAHAWQVRRSWLAPAAVFSVLILASLTIVQISRWRDSETLFNYVLSVTSDNRVVQNNLGSALGQQGKHAEAIPHFEEALRIKPDYLDALENMGLAFLNLGKHGEAMTVYQRALAVKPDSGKMHLGLGEALAGQGKNDDALEEFLRAGQLAPNDFDVRINLGQMLTRQNRYSEAIANLNEALRLNPNSAEAHNDLGIAFIMTGHPEESLRHFSMAIQLKPEMTAAQDNLKRAQKQIEAQRQ